MNSMGTVKAAAHMALKACMATGCHSLVIEGVRSSPGALHVDVSFDSNPGAEWAARRTIEALRHVEIMRAGYV